MKDSKSVVKIPVITRAFGTIIDDLVNSLQKKHETTKCTEEKNTEDTGYWMLRITRYKFPLRLCHNPVTLATPGARQSPLQGYEIASVSMQ